METATSISIKKALSRSAVLLLILGTASALGLAFRTLELPLTNIAMVYMLAILLTALLIPGYIFGFLTSILSSFAFNYLFTEPYFTFTTNVPSYLITFIIMAITAFITSSLISHAKLSERMAQEREAETRALFTLTNRLTEAANFQEIAGIAIDTISSVICEKAACLCFNEKGVPEETYLQQVSPGEQSRRVVNDPLSLLRVLGGPQGRVLMGDEFYDWPIYGKETVLGLIRLPSEHARLLNRAQTRLLSSMTESIALTMDRLHSTQQRIRLREETTQERYRSNLLRSISHDLRTPLSGILGATEMLFDMTGREDRRYPLIEGISKDAGWLFSLVENVLSLTRLQGGSLSIQKQPEAVEEILGGSVEHIARRYPQYDIEVPPPDELLLVPMDARLISQVLINLLDNAVKHTEPPGEISVTVAREYNQAVFSVKDSGCGIPEANLPHIFELFYTSHAGQSDARPGIGIGLAICESIVRAHSGTITARNRTDGPGAEFIFTLPLGGQ
jgi:two-component system sensor histidine kinase KdpD